MFHEESYKKHNDWYNLQFPTEISKIEYLKKNSSNEDTIGNWLQNIFFSCLNPLLNTVHKTTWLTVGDAYGFDAAYLLSKGADSVVASDLNSDFLKMSKDAGLIEEYSSENAENLSFNKNEFDFVLCKESYHHFPRPYAAMYEMIRVAKKGIIIIEPQDPISKMPVLLAMTNLIAKVNPSLIRHLWKNQFSFEPVGNYVYKVSEREFEKFAAGLDLPLVAFKQINPNFHSKDSQQLKSDFSQHKFKKILFKKTFLDLLVKFNLIPGQVLSAIIYKEMPLADEIARLQKIGYKTVLIPKNPYK